MDTIETPIEFDSLQLFPDCIEQNEYIFYHGTNSVYAEQIEKFGLFPNHKPLTEFFSVLIQIADDLIVTTADNLSFSSFNKIYYDVKTYFTEFTRVSFTKVSICGANYSIGRTSGGQGIRHIINLKNEIQKIDFSGLYIRISESQKHYLLNIDSEIQKLQSSDGVVYAFKLNESDIYSLEYAIHSCHAVLLTTKHIEPSNIVAKIIVPNNAVISAELANQGNALTLNLYNATPSSFIGRIIQNSKKRIELEDVYNN